MSEYSNQHTNLVGQNNTKSETSSIAERPFISVVMPVRNEGDFMSRSLEAVLKQDYPPTKMEVLVADGMSTDNTRTLIAQKFSEYPQITGKIVDNPGKIVPTGLNATLAVARGSIIVRVDGHCEIEPDYVSRCVDHLLRVKVGCVGGPIQTIGNSPLSESIALAMSSPFGVGDSTFRTGSASEAYVDTVAFPAFTREALDAAGPFDSELVRNQDDEYSYRLRSLGYKILLAPDIRSRYYSRSSLRRLWRQYYQYGYWKVRVMQKHPQQMRPRQFIPPLFVTTLIGGAILAPFIPFIRVLWLLEIALYIVANIAASLLVSSRKGWQNLMVLPLIFFILHASYGLGFLVGLIKFANRWDDKGTTPTATMKKA